MCDDPTHVSRCGRACVEREQGAAAVFDGGRAYRRGPKIPSTPSIRSVRPFFFSELKHESNRRRAALEGEAGAEDHRQGVRPAHRGHVEAREGGHPVRGGLHRRPLHLQYLPGPHYDPPSKERLKALMDVRTCPPIGSADAVSEYGDPPQLARKRRLGSRRFEEGYQVSRCICRFVEGERVYM